MKTINQLLYALVIMISYQGLHSQQMLTADQWQADLDYLQNEVHTRYSFLFDKIEKEDWDAAVTTFRTEIPNLQDHEIKVGMARMVSLFEYGHTQIPFSAIAEDAVLPVNLYHFEDGIFVEGAPKENAAIIGAKLIKIGGESVEKALAAIRPVVPVENDQYFKAYGLRFLTVPTVLHAQGVLPELTDTITLTLEKNGKTLEQALTAVPLDQLSRGYGFTIPNEQWVSGRQQNTTPLYLKHLHERLYFFEYLAESKTLYVRQSSVFNDEKETLQDFYKRLFDFVDANEIEKFIYDVRLNGGGNNYNNKSLIKGIMARPKINKKGTFFYIIGRNTFSACQNLTNEIENYTNAILVGEPTAENLNFYGDSRKVTLPNSGMNAYLSYAWWQDKPQWENKEWTLPNIAVAMQSTDYFSNNDVVLQAAMEYKADNFILRPMEYLTELFTAGKMEEVKTEGAKIAKDPRYRYYDFEKEFGTAGYRLFQNGNVQGGLYILQLVVDIYPESVGALYSLAGAQEQEKMRDQAKANYEKILTLAPDSAIGQTVRKKLATWE